MPAGWKRRFRAIFLVLLLLAGTSLYYAPRFLVCADKPVKSDAIILFLGPGYPSREKEARLLFQNGYGRFLIMPSFRQVVAATHASPAAPGASLDAQAIKNKSYPWYYENTHREVLYAKEAMETLGLRSAIMVSSPYHLRRIRMITAKTFGENARFISCVPASCGRNPVALSGMDRSDWVLLAQEYVKICWFRMYALFSGDGPAPTSTKGNDLKHGHVAH